MALLMLEGFDCYGNAGATNWNNANLALQIQRNWDTLSTTGGYASSPITATGRGPVGAVGAQFFSDSANDQFLQRSFGTPASNTTILAFSWQITQSTGNANHAIVTLLDSAAVEMGRLYVNSGSAGQLIYRNGSSTTILTTTFSGGFSVTTPPTWYTIELFVTAGTTTGFVQINVNGSSAGSASSVNTVGTANTSGMGSLRLGSNAGTANFNNHIIDHLVVMDGSGSLLNNFIGEKRITTLLPNGVGSHSDWTPTGATPNWACVDEAAIDGDTTYNATSTVGNTDSYTLGDLPTTTQAVYAVGVSGHIRKDDGATRQCQPLVRSGGTDALIGSPATINATYNTRFTALAAQNPVTSAAWTNSDVQALEVGARVTT